jgi:hypothetical protein
MPCLGEHCLESPIDPGPSKRQQTKKKNCHLFPTRPRAMAAGYLNLDCCRYRLTDRPVLPAPILAKLSQN